MNRKPIIGCGFLNPTALTVTLVNYHVIVGSENLSEKVEEAPAKKGVVVVAKAAAKARATARTEGVAGVFVCDHPSSLAQHGIPVLDTEYRDGRWAAVRVVPDDVRGALRKRHFLVNPAVDAATPDVTLKRWLQLAHVEPGYTGSTGKIRLALESVDNGSTCNGCANLTTDDCQVADWQTQRCQHYELSESARRVRRIVDIFTEGTKPTVGQLGPIGKVLHEVTDMINPKIIKFTGSAVAADVFRRMVDPGYRSGVVGYRKVLNRLTTAGLTAEGKRKITQKAGSDAAESVWSNWADVVSGKNINDMQLTPKETADLLLALQHLPIGILECKA